MRLTSKQVVEAFEDGREMFRSWPELAPLSDGPTKIEFTLDQVDWNGSPPTMMWDGEYLYVLRETRLRRLRESEGGIIERLARVNPATNEIYEWWDEHEVLSTELTNLALYARRKNAAPVERHIDRARGYGGGHASAAKYGWSCTPPHPREGAHLWWNATKMGTWGGCWPATVSVLSR